MIGRIQLKPFLEHFWWKQALNWEPPIPSCLLVARDRENRLQSIKIFQWGALREGREHLTCSEPKLTWIQYPHLTKTEIVSCQWELKVLSLVWTISAIAIYSCTEGCWKGPGGYSGCQVENETTACSTASEANHTPRPVGRGEVGR